MTTHPSTPPRRPTKAQILAAARALIARAEQRSPAFHGRAHEAVGEREYAALAAVVRAAEGRKRSL